ncbi:hypothetical protein ACHQM5_020728 [Ranunculus cassubicifolius]
MVVGGFNHWSLMQKWLQYFAPINKDLQSKLRYNSRHNSGDSIKISVPSAPWLGLLTKDKKLSLYSVAADINQATTNSTDTESGNPEKTPTSESIPKTLESPSSNGGVVSSKSVKRSSLTAREKLRAARVLKRVDTKPAKSEFGSKVLDALRESERGKKRSRLPEAPSNMLDDSKRGMPKQGLTFDFPGGFDLFVIVLSFVLITTTMVATTYIVWKLGAIHFND